MSERACRDCHRIVKGDDCPVCHSGALSSDWSGYVIIIDPARSRIAQKMDIKTRGKFALKVR